MNLSLADAMAPLTVQHQAALQWFIDHAGTIQPWPDQRPDGTFLATKAKGIYKPSWSQYALSIRQTVGGPYPDKDPVSRADGSWHYAYFQEGKDPTARDAEFTNKGLMACCRDRVPVGVMRQVTRKPQKVTYRVLGVALVAGWEDGYFQLEGFSHTGLSYGQGPTGQVQDLEDAAALKAGKSGHFEPSDLTDAREKMMAAIVRRRGQPAFRRKLLKVYRETCVITGFNVAAALEAAQIVPYEEKHTNHLCNGLLLRADIHTLFDTGLLAIDEHNKTVILAEELMATAYGPLHGRPILDPNTSEALPSKEALRKHRLWACLMTDAERNDVS